MKIQNDYYTVTITSGRYPDVIEVVTPEKQSKLKAINSRVKRIATRRLIRMFERAIFFFLLWLIVVVAGDTSLVKATLALFTRPHVG